MTLGEIKNKTDLLPQAVFDLAQAFRLLDESPPVEPQLAQALPSHPLKAALHHRLRLLVGHQKTTSLLTSKRITHQWRRPDSGVFMEMEQMTQLDEVGHRDIGQHLEGTSAHTFFWGEERVRVSHGFTTRHHRSIRE